MCWRARVLRDILIEPGGAGTSFAESVYRQMEYELHNIESIVISAQRSNFPPGCAATIFRRRYAAAPRQIENTREFYSGPAVRRSRFANQLRRAMRRHGA